ncbi:5-formyltetrahydrofolate cyclo-ligase [Sphingomonas sp. LY160]|uniref:5-formyltetrahydrofolate cyclo-ligase n=1 Tax=Sphingomonas sp. LY160 TaxID=3095342 RepID=UPI002ADED74C|nr:5-formyltetrahydrofolate cyclo-ligase [Sphingomonas sp. LY160]MEA1071419.1 5-formyltetrahydrofolate cyclo-ligase [Sphingomonas sp. LY160]
MTKAELRRAVRAARKKFVASLSAEQRDELERRLADNLSPLLADASAVGGYHAIGGEIDPALILHRAARHALPTFDSGISSFVFREGPATDQGPHGIPQPAVERPELHPAVILVPLVAIDPAGYRIGQGGGYYDRVLPGLRERGARLIGLGWPLQRLDFAFARDPWDVPLDGFASPDGLEIF